MNNLLMAMLKGDKTDAFTQVDEGELYWNQKLVVKSEKLNLPNVIDATFTSVNVNNNIDLYK
jgi:hypothetical protein